MTEIVDFLKNYYAQWGYLIVFLGAYFENTVLLGLILPGGTLILLGALYAQQGYLWLPVIIILGTIGMFLGSSTDYGVGRLGLHRVLERTRFWSKVESSLEKARGFMDKRGAYAIFLSHFIGHIRAFVALTAGASHYPYRKFALFEFGAALLWNIIFCGVGYFLGNNLDLIEKIYARFGIGLVIVLVVGFIGWKIWRGYKERQKKALPKQKTSPTKTKL